MTLEAAIRATEILLALAVLQRGAEHLGRETWLFVAQMLCAVPVLLGLGQGVALAMLWILFLVQLWRFDGPYNGGADKMLMLVLTGLTATRLVPGWADVAMAYLAFQLVLSYVVSGAVKLRNPAWRRGQALCDVFEMSIYPVSEDLRALARHPRLMGAGSWAVMVFEVGFPLALLSLWSTALALAAAASFHLANAVFFGLNRFVWAWVAAFPSLLWAQVRIFG